MKLSPKAKKAVKAKTKAAPEPEEVEVAVEEAAPRSNQPTRRAFRLEMYIPAGKTSREAQEWVQKFFDFYHRSLEAKILEETT